MEMPKILTEKQINSALKDLPGWSFSDNKISKEFKFNDFLDSLSFIASLTPYFENLDHHPDVHIFYSKVLFELSRFDVGGKVTTRDIEVAHLIENAYKKR